MGAVRLVCCASVKGGVGKTTVAVGVAQALHRKGLKVGILDLDYRSPCVPLVMGDQTGQLLHGPNDSIQPCLISGIAVMSMAYIWPPDKCVMVEDKDAVDDVKQLLRTGTIEWPALDFLVVDSPPTSSGIVVATLSHPGISGALAISHPSSVSRAALLRTLDLFAEHMVPVYGVVSNQGMDEGKTRFDLSDDDIQAVAKEFGLPLCFVLPHKNKLGSYFDELVDKLITVSPVILPRKVPTDRVWKEFVNLARTLRKL